MTYPASYRPSRPSTGRSAVAPSPWSFPNRGGRSLGSVGKWSFPNQGAVPKQWPRLPGFGSGRGRFLGALLAGTILDSAISVFDYHSQGGDSGMYAPSDFNMSGWTHLCGPVGAPVDYSYPIINRFSDALAAGWGGGGGAGVCGLANQSIAGLDVIPGLGSRARYRFWSKIAGAGAGDRFAVAEEWGRNPAADAPLAVLMEVAPTLALNVPGVLTLTPYGLPAATRPVPIALIAAVPWPRHNHEGPSRGYVPPTTLPSPASDTPYSDAVVRVIARPADRVYADPERKVPVNSKAGQALTQAFKLLSVYGTSEAFINALWRALPSHLRSSHARNGQKLLELAQNWSSISFGDAFANSLMVGVNTALAGAMYGAATKTLTETFGEAGGFGLYRAWSTGEFAYRTGPSIDAYRINRGGGSVAERQPNNNPWGHGSTSWQRTRTRQDALRRAKRARAARRRHNNAWHTSASERRMAKRIRALRTLRRARTIAHRTRTARRHARIHRRG